MPSLLGDFDRDRGILRRAKRDVVAWRIRAVLLAVLAVLFFRRAWHLFGVAFVVLAVGAWRISHYTSRKADELLKKLDLLERSQP